MDPVSNADRLVILLRQKLQERSRTSPAAARSGNAGGQGAAQKTGLQELAALEGVGEQPLRRAFVQQLLADQLGDDLVNDAQFQLIVSRVTEAIEEDEAASQLLSRVLADLRAP